MVRKQIGLFVEAALLACGCTSVGQQAHAGSLEYLANVAFIG